MFYEFIINLVDMCQNYLKNKYLYNNFKYSNDSVAIIYNLTF